MKESEQKIRDRQQVLIESITAIDEVLKTKAWQTLKELVFDSRVESLKRQLLSEAEADEPNLKRMYRLQGELTWARRYSDLKSYAEKLSSELLGIKDNLK